MSSKFGSLPKAILSSVIAMTLSGALAGCSGLFREKITPDTTASAYLDPTNGQIIMPLTEYDVLGSATDMQVYSQAWDIATAQCMKNKGFTYTVTLQDSVVDDRQYGAWYLENAKKYGIDFPQSASSIAYERDRENGGEAWLAAEQSCGDELRNDAEFQATRPKQEDTTGSLASDLKTQAYRYAREDPAWEAAFRKWEKCLEENGLHAKQDLDAWSTTESTALAESHQSLSSEEAIRIAVTAAECNNKTQAAQTVANLVASYEAPLIKKNQAALNEEKNRKQELLENAREYIATHG